MVFNWEQWLTVGPVKHVDPALFRGLGDGIDLMRLKLPQSAADLTPELLTSLLSRGVYIGWLTCPVANYGWEVNIMAHLRVTTAFEDHRTRQLLQELLGLEKRERQTISERLHDGALQYVLVARQDMEDVRDGSIVAADRVESALAECSLLLRDVVRELHPDVLARLGLKSAIAALTEEYLKRISRYTPTEGVSLRDEKALLELCGRASGRSRGDDRAREGLYPPFRPRCGSTTPFPGSTRVARGGVQWPLQSEESAVRSPIVPRRSRCGRAMSAARVEIHQIDS